MKARLGLSLVLFLASIASATAQLAPGAPSAPFLGPGPIVPGLYAGIKDQTGVAISWVRITGIKDRGDIVPYVRGSWGNGIVNVPLTDVYTMEFKYSEGHIHADIRLLTGETMNMELENPFTELQGYWRQNPYSVHLSGIRQVWFRYITPQETSSESYAGAPMNVVVDGVVTSLELNGNGGNLTVESKTGEAVQMRFEYNRMHSGVDLLLNKAAWLVGHNVRVLYRLTAMPDQQALREVRDIQLSTGTSKRRK